MPAGREFGRVEELRADPGGTRAVGVGLGRHAQSLAAGLVKQGVNSINGAARGAVDVT